MGVVLICVVVVFVPDGHAHMVVFFYVVGGHTDVCYLLEVRVAPVVCDDTSQKSVKCQMLSADQIKTHTEADEISLLAITYQKIVFKTPYLPEPREPNGHIRCTR